MQHSMQSTNAPPHARQPSGRPLVAGLVLLGVSLACFAIWFQWRQTRRCLDFYGSDVARQVQAAARVELWRPPSSAEPQPGLDAAIRTDISRAPGLVHLRRGLVEDANFDWKRPASTGAEWDAAFAFYDEASAAAPATVLVIDFDPAGGTLAVAGRDRRVGLGRIEKGLRSWLAALAAEK